jgi:hypothetical protein
MAVSIVSQDALSKSASAMVAGKRFHVVGEIGVSNLMRPEKRTRIFPFGFLLAFFL